MLLCIRSQAGVQKRTRPFLSFAFPGCARDRLSMDYFQFGFSASLSLTPVALCVILAPMLHCRKKQKIKRRANAATRADLNFGQEKANRSHGTRLLSDRRLDLIVNWGIGWLGQWSNRGPSSEAAKLCTSQHAVLARN